MTANDFNKLETGDKAEILYPAGMFLDCWIEDDIMFVVYKMPNFFVEVNYDIFSSDITSITALGTDFNFEGYLNRENLFKMLN